jgi:hypothetical protein
LKGTLRGRDVTFQIDVTAGAVSRTHVFNGRLGADGIIRGAIAVADVGGTFTAKKQ